MIAETVTYVIEIGPDLKKALGLLGVMFLLGMWLNGALR